MGKQCAEKNYKVNISQNVTLVQKKESQSLVLEKPFQP